MYSFDIFDTLITRATAEPKGIFKLMQEIMREKGGYPPFLTENFYELRVGAEELAWRYVSSRGKREVTLSDILQARGWCTRGCIFRSDFFFKFKIFTKWISIRYVYSCK